MVRPIHGLLLLLVVPAHAWAQSFDQVTRPVATLVRPAQIDSFLNALLIPPPDTVSTVDIVDLTGNGYGPDDMVILYPSQAIYPLGADVPRTLQDIMKTWELAADYRLDATLEESYTLEVEAHRQQDPRSAISGSVIRTIANYYDGADMDLRLSRGEDGLRLEMWNYDPDALQYRPQTAAACGPAATQWFAFAKPRFVLAFSEPGTCMEVRQDGNRVITRLCDND